MGPCGVRPFSKPIGVSSTYAADTLLGNTQLNSPPVCPIRTIIPWVYPDLWTNRAVSAASHSLDTIWAGYRIRNTLDLREKYEQYAVRSACDGVDILEKWWDVRLSRAVSRALVYSARWDPMLPYRFLCLWRMFWPSSPFS